MPRQRVEYNLVLQQRTRVPRRVCQSRIMSEGRMIPTAALRRHVASAALMLGCASGCSGPGTPTVPTIASPLASNQPVYPSAKIVVTADAGSTPIPVNTGLPLTYQVYVDRLVPGTPVALYGCWSAKADELTERCPAMAVSPVRSDGTVGWSATTLNWSSGAVGEFWYFLVVVRTAPHLPPLIPALVAGTIPGDAALVSAAASHVIFQ